MKTRFTRLGALAAAIALTTSIAGCSGSPSTDKVSVGPDVTVYLSDDMIVEATVGQEFAIDFGVINTSVGDEWEVIEEPDGTIVSDFSSDMKYLGEDDMVGAPSELKYVGEAAAPGSTEIVFRYTYRGDRVADHPDVKATVTVTEP
ncbi:MAG TPA: hypothetical protein VK030_00145 [Actinomycetales bacterium]|nr:hypothetical protein [Actinomycetales bacterium]